MLCAVCCVGGVSVSSVDRIDDAKNCAHLSLSHTRTQHTAYICDCAARSRHSNSVICFITTIFRSRSRAHISFTLPIQFIQINMMYLTVIHFEFAFNLRGIYFFFLLLLCLWLLMLSCMLISSVDISQIATRYSLTIHFNFSIDVCISMVAIDMTLY